MARIAGVDLPKKKHMEIALTYIHGIGRTSARKILDEVKLPYIGPATSLHVHILRKHLQK